MKNNDSKSKKNEGVINVGIDLGTTNSAIAVNVGNKTEIVKNAAGADYTPSVFGIDKSGNKVVGIKAYDRLYKSSSEEEFQNNKAEVKRLMGTSETIHFERLNTDLSPEEISSEILKSLKEDVTRKYSDLSTVAAVITIPAHFSSLQAEATKRAGLLAGFKYIVLLQEPIAAAMAYGFEKAADENWLVYDLGGGTFDVALISSKDSNLTVLGHSGDNFLGGKDFDLKIVDEVIKPEILKKFKLTDFDRSSEKYSSIFARLKAIAESAKIELSQYDKSTIEVEDIGKDENGEDIYVSVNLDRSQFEDLIKPSVAKTVELVKNTLKDSGIAQSSVTKIVLVGGPTQIPYIRETLQDEFKLSVDGSIDPLTVVACGAAIFGLSQRIPTDILLEGRESVSEEKNVTLHYDSMTSDDDQTVTGIVEELRDEGGDYYIQIQSDSGFYTSSKIKLRNGKFFDTVAIEKGKTNAFWLYLFDDAGNTLPMFPDSFSITHGMTVGGAPIPHDIGVIYASKGFDSGFQMTEVCDPYFEKNSIPPLKKANTYKTVKKLEKGKENNLPIKVYEGESANPSNNEVITTLQIDGKKLPYDLPAGTEVDITITVDESRSVVVEAYIPSVELTLNARADTYKQDVNVAELEKDLAVQKERLKTIKNNVSEEEYSQLENTIDDLGTNIKNANLDNDDKSKAERDMRELKTNFDKLESSKELPQLTDEFRAKIENAREVLSELDDSAEKQQGLSEVSELEKDGEKAVREKDKTMLLRVNEQIEQVTMRSVFQNPAAWVYMLNQIKEKRNELANKTDADYFIEKADKAVNDGDVEELKRCVRSLLDLLPKDTQEEINANMSGITK
ncbi:MAG TPA: Hsp70 family protein [Candidatus Saccharimonadales bacterium]